MICGSSRRGQICAAVVLALLAAFAHACASLSAAPSGVPESAPAHHGAPVHTAMTHESCCAAGLSRAPASASSATVRAHVLPFATPVAATMAPPLHQMVAAMPAPIPHRRLPLFLLHAVLRV